MTGAVVLIVLWVALAVIVFLIERLRVRDLAEADRRGL